MHAIEGLQVTGSSFGESFKYLNGHHTYTLRKIDLRRCMLKVGYLGAEQAIDEVGPWRAVALCAMMEGYLDDELRPTEYFLKLERSEKGAMSFLMGQAFAQWYCETQLRVPNLVHLSNPDYSKSKNIGGAIKNDATPPKVKSQPDFIGISHDAYDIVESKGRSGPFTKHDRQHALGQVSNIGLVNGEKPRLRLVTALLLKKEGCAGIVVDPEGEDVYDITFDEAEALRRAYAFFLRPEFIDAEPVQFIGDYVCHPTTEDYLFGVDRRLLPLLRDSFARDGSERIKQYIAGRGGQYYERAIVNSVPPGFAQASFGLDGTVLLRR